MSDVSARRTLFMLMPIPVFAAGVWVGAKMFASEIDDYVLKPEKILDDDTFNTYFEHKPLVQEAYFTKLANRTVRRPGAGLYDLYVIERFRPALEKYAGGIADKTILELGPGENLATGLILMMAGAQKYYGLDIYRPTNFDSPGPYQSAIELMYAHPDLTKRSASGIFEVRDGKAALDPARIVYLYPHESYDIPLPDESMDIVFSHYSFEHFNEPQKTIDAIRRVLKPGGVSVHVIGMLDHRDFSKPYAYYAIDEATWRKEMLQPGQIQDFTNRWTARRFEKAFADSGFEVLETSTEPDEISRAVLGAHGYKHAPITEDEKKTFAPEFQSLSVEELSVTYLFVAARKKALLDSSVSPR